MVDARGGLMNKISPEVIGPCIRGTRYLARKKWIEKYGLLPYGLCLLHACDNHLCVNIDHLFLGTQSVNMKDCVQKGRAVSNWPDRTGQLCSEKHKAMISQTLTGRSLSDEHKVALKAAFKESLSKPRITYFNGKPFHYINGKLVPID